MPSPLPPRVSVIIPCFNLGRYLAEAMASVAAQTLRDVETVVVDDGSTEAATIEALERLEGQAAPGLTVVRSENCGLSAARNLGIARARAPYICCLDADDVLEPEWLELGAARLDADPGLAFVSHWVEAFGDESGPWTPGRSDLGALLDQNVFNGAALFRRGLVDDVGGFDESMREGCEDWEFWIRVLAAGKRGATIPEVLYRYRRRSDSMSRVMTDTGRWFDLYGTLVDAHPDEYREHLLDLLLRREWAIGSVCRGIDGVRDELATVLEPAVSGREHELDAVRARLAGPAGGTPDARLQALEDDRRALDRERAQVHAEVEALRRSWSWRLTAPLRRVYGWLVPHPGSRDRGPA